MSDITVTSEYHSAPRYELPNKMEIAYQSRVELGHFYEDIFEKQIYLQHGITLNEGDCVFDVGANIGLFTLFIASHCPGVQVYSFEPAPPLFEILRTNASRYAPAAHLFNFGLAGETRDATFTFYPNSSGMSSFYGDEEEEKDVLRAIMQNQLDQGVAGMEEVMKYADDLLAERLKTESFTCRLETLSNVLRAHNVERIDLLKVDVQKCEEEVLLGIEEEDWKKIRQIVVEVHDFDGRLERISAQLKHHGYRVVMEQDQMYQGSLMYNLYAIRSAPVMESTPASDSRSWQLIALSAKSAEALDRATDNLLAYLREHPEANLADVAYTLQTGRKSLAYRRALVCRDHADASMALETRDPRRVSTSGPAVGQTSVAFMFSGLGNHYVNMARELYQTESVFRKTVDQCCEYLKPQLGLDLREILYPSGTSAPAMNGNGIDLRKMLRRGDVADEGAGKLNQSLISQPALFVVEYALARLWMSWGIHPEAMIGYSIGEYVAACLAGVFSLEDALLLVAKRAQMIQSLPGGAMLAVPLSEAEVQPLLSQQLTLSALNGPGISVVGGPTTAVVELQQQLTQAGLACQRLQVVHAFHSNMMSPILESFTELTAGMKLNPPSIPYLSNVTGDWITAEQAQDPKYWGEHLCKPVRFGDGVQRLWQQSNRILLEVGPGQTLCAWAMQQPEIGERVALPSLRHSFEQQSDTSFILNTLGRLWLLGVPIDWPAFYADERRCRIEAQPLRASSNLEPEAEPAELDQTESRRLIPTPYVAARNELEAELSQVWREVLNGHQVGIWDNFFALGGDSIRATQLVTRVSKTFQTTLSLRDVFNSPTVADLAVIIVQRQAEQADAGALAQVLREIKQLS